MNSLAQLLKVKLNGLTKDKNCDIIDMNKRRVMRMIGIYMFENIYNHKKYIG